MAFLRKRGKIHVENTEKPTFLILKDDSILRTAFSESPITSLKLKQLSNQRIKRRSDWCEIHTLMRRSDYCEIHTLNNVIGASSIPLSVCNLDVIFFK